MRAFKTELRQDGNAQLIEDLIVGKPQYGTSKKANTDGVGIPVLRMGNIQQGQLDFGNMKHVDIEPSEVDKYRLERGDLVFNRTNSAEQVGKSAIFDQDEPMVFASYLIRATFDQGVINPWLVNYYINSPLGKQYIQSQLQRAIGQVNVNAQKLKAMPIPLPPTKLEQDRLVASFDAFCNEIAEMDDLNHQDGKLLEDMEQSILAQAFRGEL